MPKKSDKKPKTNPESSPQLNKAKAAFEEYKKKMVISAGKQPHMYMSQPPFPPQPGMIPPNPFLSNPHPSYMPFKQSDEPFFSSLGGMIKLSMNLVNAGLAGGLQLMEGFAGGGSGGNCCCAQPPASCSCNSEPCCDSYGYTSCCEPCGYSCEPCGCACGCNPGVHNCC